jgi:DNA-binding CsgD family transcriptional regulator
VLQVRTLFAQGTYSKRELGKLLNIHEKTIGNIVLRRSWKHLP